jgi:hypothetical protein
MVSYSQKGKRVGRPPKVKPVVHPDIVPMLNDPAIEDKVKYELLRWSKVTLTPDATIVKARKRAITSLEREKRAKALRAADPFPQHKHVKKYVVPTTLQSFRAEQRRNKDKKMKSLKNNDKK